MKVPRGARPACRRRMLTAMLAATALGPLQGCRTPPGAGAAAPRIAPAGVISGTVRDVSPTGEWFTLDSGVTLRLPRPPAFVRDDLQPGAFVTADYSREGGENVVRRIVIQRPDGERGE